MAPQHSSTRPDQPRRIEVWFGDQIVASHQAPAWQARRYVTLMGRRFAGLRITIDEEPTGREPALPHELLWELTVR